MAKREESVLEQIRKEAARQTRGFPREFFPREKLARIYAGSHRQEGAAGGDLRARFDERGSSRCSPVVPNQDESKAKAKQDQSSRTPLPSAKGGS